MDLFEKIFVACMATPLDVGADGPSNPGCLWGLNLNFIGSPGEGKSKQVKLMGRLMGMPVYCVYAATKQPEHIAGFPVMTPEGFNLECALSQVRAAMDSDNSIIFLDEISSAPRAVQAALLSFVNERTVGDYSLPPGVRIVLAMNPPDTAANGRDLEQPLANRVVHIEYPSPSPESWMKYELGVEPDDVPPIARIIETVKDRWSLYFPSTIMSMGGFFKATAGAREGRDEKSKKYKWSNFNFPPDPTDEQSGGAWPSPRSWSAAAHGVTACRCLKLGAEVEHVIVEGCVGKGAATEYLSHCKKMNLPQPEEALKPTWPMPNRLDILHVVLPSCGEYVESLQSNPPEQIKAAVACWNLIKRVWDEGNGDITRPTAQLLIKIGLGVEHDDNDVKAACAGALNDFADPRYVTYMVGK